MQQHGIFVTGTDTNVGKTYVGQILVRALVEQAITVRVRKPIESGWTVDEDTTDAALLRQAAGGIDALKVVCPNPLHAAISPVRAATLEGKILQITDLKQQCLANVNANTNDFLYVEGAGGFYSPLTSDGLNADLAQQLALPILLIAEDKLGCINQVLLTLEAIEKKGLTVLAIVLNKKNDDPNRNDHAMNNYEELMTYTSKPIFRCSYKQATLPPALLALLLTVRQM